MSPQKKFLSQSFLRVLPVAIFAVILLAFCLLLAGMAQAYVKNSSSVYPPDGQNEFTLQVEGNSENGLLVGFDAADGHHVFQTFNASIATSFSLKPEEREYAVIFRNDVPFKGIQETNVQLFLHVGRKFGR